MKAKRGILILSILIGLITAVGIYRIVQSMDQTPEVTIVYEKVVAANSTIPEFTILTAEMLQLIDVPAEAVHAEAITDLEQAVGTMTSALIVKDEQILTSRLISTTGDEAQNLSFHIPENMRAISIPINELSAVSGHITQGDRIDIMVTYNLPDFYPGYTPERPSEDNESEPTGTDEEPADTDVEPTDTEEPDESAETPDETSIPPESSETETTAERNITTVYTQFQLVEVLRIGPPGYISDGGSMAGSMVLLVTPEQAEELVYSLNTGSITLLLRNPADDTIDDLEFYNADVFREDRGIE